MAQPPASNPPPNTLQPSKKRKEPPANAPPSKPNTAKRQKVGHRARQRDARRLSTQTTSKAFQNGALDVDKFVQAREFEIRALERGMQRSGKANNRRAFQQVPAELRRRTASHNVKRIPKRLRARAGKEMLEDNTPTVTAKTRKPTRQARLRMENVKRLRALGAQKRREKAEKETAEQVTVIDPQAPSENPAAHRTTDTSKSASSTIQSRPAKVKRKAATLATPPTPKSRFRKRQQHKSWLPTHLFHSKRAHVTPPSAPLWRFAIPLTPTQKCYRPTHRAAFERGAVAWDVSYTATIGLQGREDSILGVLRGLGVDVGMMAGRWKEGRRVLRSWVHERESREPIAPVELLWRAPETAPDRHDARQDEAKRKRALFVRVHPSAFFQLWEGVVRLAKIAKPAVTVEDLRFEIGSIEITGPGSTEALLGALWPSDEQAEGGGMEQTWASLAGLSNPALLPEGALLAFDVQDPRLHHPPRTISLPQTQEEHDKLLHLAAHWPPDNTPTFTSGALFDRTARLKGSKLPSQKAINRRKSLAPPGTYPSTLSTDPQIPILLYTSPSTTPYFSPDQRKPHRTTSNWTLLAPWRTITPIWYSIIYYPLSTGQQPRFGGLNEKRQLAFEAGRPWFPADYPGTFAGWEWEVKERRRRWEEWVRRPKGKRVAWEKVELAGGGGGAAAAGRKGEVGQGWACDWGFLLGRPERSCGDEGMDVDPSVGNEDGGVGDGMKSKEGDAEATTTTTIPQAAPPPKPKGLSHISSTQALQLLNSPASAPTNPDLEGKLTTVHLTLLARGVPQTCARIYRLPSTSTNPELRKAWLALAHPPTKKRSQQKRDTFPLHRLTEKEDRSIQQQRLLAASLLQPPTKRAAGRVDAAYPACPPEEDLIGFVTTGNFNLAEGKGTGVGCLLLSKVLSSVGDEDEEAKGKGKGRRLCVVRNSGEAGARLAWWEVV